MRIGARVMGLAWIAGVAFVVPATVELSGQTAQFDASAEVFRIQVGLQGPDGKHAAGLAAGDLELLVNGQPRRILDLREIDAAQLAAAPVPSAEVELATTTTREPSRTVLQPAMGAEIPTAARRRFLLFFDLGFINRRGLGYARGAAKTFLDDIVREGDMVGLATYSAGRGLQYHVPFTSDREQIRRIVDGLGISRANEGIDNARLDLEALSLAMAGAGLGDDALDVSQDLERTARQFEAGRVILALEDLAEAVAPLQGRKHILYFSAGLPDGMIWSPDGDGGVHQEMTTAVETARRADVVVHSLMPAVMPVAGMHDVTNMQSTFNAGSQIRTIGDRGFMHFVAGETGGTASFFRHQLKGGLEEVEESTRSYYLLAFPILQQDDSTISVEVVPRRAEVEVAWAPARLTLPRGQQHSVASRQLQIADALEVGSDVRGMQLDVLAVRVGQQDGYGRIAIVGEIPSQQLSSLVEERGDDRLDLEILGVVLKSTGEVADHFRTGIKLEDVAQKLAAIDAPLRYQNVLAVAPGTYFVKILVREAVLSRFASRSLRLEIPETEPAEFAVETPLMVLPAAPGSFIRGVDPENPPAHRAGLPLSYPFVIGAQPLVPLIRPNATAAADVDFLVNVRYPTPHPFTGQPALAAQAWLESDDGNRFVISALRVMASTYSPDDNVNRMLLRLSLSPAIPSGRYSLIMNINDRIADTSTSSWTELVIESDFERVE